MALIHCPECSDPVSDSATICPNCGFHLRRQRWKARAVRWLRYTLYGLAALLTLGLLLSMVDDMLHREDRRLRMGAIEVCQDTVGQEPTLAESVQLPDPHFGSLGSGQYLVNGTVKARYLSGLTLDREYRCVLERDDGAWTVMKYEYD